MLLQNTKNYLSTNQNEICVHDYSFLGGGLRRRLWEEKIQFYEVDIYLLVFSISISTIF